ncbi:prepilin peptidase [Olsenella massiliensis]|uniref:prepilin peptidase n=1 Tax=Olsenella massiliensis TaxID=1622075 RepID=UPI0009E84F8A|nr:prepilin peptidase [Olsenella massiliensis]
MGLTEVSLGMQAAEPVVILVPLAWLSVADLRRRVIPNACVVSLFAIHVLLAGGGMLVGGSGPVGVLLTLASSLIQSVASVGVLVALALVMDRVLGRPSVGGGDVKLLGAVTFCVGWEAGLLVLALGCLLGLAFVGARALLAGRSRRARRDLEGHPAGTFAWGPWLSLAFALVMPLTNRALALLLRGW